jgi:uncharacterized membrane protein
MAGAQASAAESRIHLLFQVSLLVKGAFALLEVAAGAVVYVVDADFAADFVSELAQAWLAHDLPDYVAPYLAQAANGWSPGSQHFVGFYLLSHGVVKGVLIGGLLRRKLGYYPLSIGVFALFAAYQLFRYQETHSAWLLALTVLDMVIIWLTLQEYRYLKSRWAPVPVRSWTSQ